MVIRLRNAEAVARAAATAVVESAFKAIHEHGDFCLVVAGGNTPRAAYQLLAGDLRDEVDWKRVMFYFGDERCVPPDHPQSNYRMVRRALLDPLKLPPSVVRRIPGELPPENAAAEYDAELRRLARERQPAFDLALLGMGPEGHTASLFPGSAALGETTRLAVAVTVKAKPRKRVTMTPAALALAPQILFQVTGSDKADALAQVFTEGSDLPAARVAALTVTRFLVDEEAAALLPT